MLIQATTIISNTNTNTTTNTRMRYTITNTTTPNNKFKMERCSMPVLRMTHTFPSWSWVRLLRFATTQLYWYVLPNTRGLW
jgi:hypothetical protein